MDNARPEILEIVQSILDDEMSVNLLPKDIALLVMIRHAIDSGEDSSLSIPYSSIQALHSRIDDLGQDWNQGAERRLSESILRLAKAECLVRADMMRLGQTADTEYQLTPVGEAISDWRVASFEFSGEPLTAIFRTFTVNLLKISEDAEKALTEDDWDMNVVQAIRHGLKSLLLSIQHHQKDLDRQHTILREFVPTLLTQGSEISINQCESQLSQVIKTINDLQEVVLISTNKSYALIDKILELAKKDNPKGVVPVCDELSRRIQNVDQWTTQRATSWMEHHNVVHNFLRTIVRVDRQRRVTDALKRSVSVVPNWSIELADEPKFVRMREDAVKVPAKKSPPRLPITSMTKPREFDEVTEDGLPGLLLGFLLEDIDKGEARASSVMSRVAGDANVEVELVKHFPWLVEIMGYHGKLDLKSRDWVSVTPHIEIEEVRITK